jgi:hypothetical protein
LEDVLRTEADAKGLWWTQVTRKLPDEIKKGLLAYWSELRALEVALDGIADEFGGEDVLKPITRADLDKTREKALGIHAFFQDLDESFELSDALEEDVLSTRALIDKWADNRG